MQRVRSGDGRSDRIEAIAAVLLAGFALGFTPWAWVRGGQAIDSLARTGYGFPFALVLVAVELGGLGLVGLAAWGTGIALAALQARRGRYLPAVVLALAVTLTGLVGTGMPLPWAALRLPDFGANRAEAPETLATIGGFRITGPHDPDAAGAFAPDASKDVRAVSLGQRRWHLAWHGQEVDVCPPDGSGCETRLLRTVRQDPPTLLLERHAPDASTFWLFEDGGHVLKRTQVGRVLGDRADGQCAGLRDRPEVFGDLPQVDDGVFFDAARSTIVPACAREQGGLLLALSPDRRWLVYLDAADRILRVEDTQQADGPAHARYRVDANTPRDRARLAEAGFWRPDRVRGVFGWGPDGIAAQAPYTLEPVAAATSDAAAASAGRR